MSIGSCRARIVFLAAAAVALSGILAAQTIVPQKKMGAAIAGLAPAEQARFALGRTAFTHQLTVAEGLGPTMNQTACSSCHSTPIGGSGNIFVTRFGSYDIETDTFDPLESLGGSLLQAQTINVACQETIPPTAGITAHRITTSTLGLGLIEAIPDADILAAAANPPAGTSGVAHMVNPLESPALLRVGRFGWKAQVATVLSFSGDASLNEMGLTNRLVAGENAPNGNTALLQAFDTVADPEDHPDALGVEFIDRVTDFQRLLAAPPQTPRSGMTGATLFSQIGCAACHTPTFTTANDPALPVALRNVVIHPYSDFLLHDMGISADFIAQGNATMYEIRTPPLWGVRVRDPLWHDGRIAGGTFLSRILGVVNEHAGFGSEAASSAAAFNALSFASQSKVVDFLNSLGRAEFDADGDNTINYNDLAAFLAAEGQTGVTADSPLAIFDIDQNGTINSADFASLALAFDIDANQNGVSDLTDILDGTSYDANQNWVPDELEFHQLDGGFAGSGTLNVSIAGDPLTSSASRATALVTGAAPFGTIYVVASPTAAVQPVGGGETLIPAAPYLFLLPVTADSGGVFANTVPGADVTFQIYLQCGQIMPDLSIDLSNALLIHYGP